MQYFPCSVVEVRSGDDIVFMADLQVARLYKQVRVRLKGVDTPNAKSQIVSEEAISVRTKVENVLKASKKILIEVPSLDNNPIICVVYLMDEEGTRYSLNDSLISWGYAKNKAVPLND